MQLTLLVLFFVPAALATDLCSVGSGDYEESDFVAPVAHVGAVIEEVSLPCSPEFKINVSDVILDWSKDGDVIYSLRGETAIFPHASYEGRVSVLPEQLRNNNNASLRLSGVKESDEGAYCCCVTVGENTTCSAVVLRPDYVYICVLERDHHFIDCPQCPFYFTFLGITLFAAVCVFVWLIKKNQTKDKSQRNDILKEEKPLVTTLMFTAEPQFVEV